MIEVERTPLGAVSIDERALVRLVRDAALAVNGVCSVRPRRGVKLEVLDGGGPAVSVVVSARMGAVLPDVGRGVQRQVAGALHASLGAAPTRIDVAVEAVES